MAFVNEYITPEDMEKFGLKEIDKKFFVGATNARDWTIDREREIYLRNVTNGREELRHISGWTFYWHGELLWLEIHTLSAKGERGGPCWARELLHSMQSFNSHELAAHLQPKREEILADLKQALLAYKDGGVFASCTDYTLTLEIE